MSTPTWLISRRTALKAAGCAIALPLLEAMIAPKLWAGDPKPRGKDPVRMAVLFFANGVPPGTWVPKTKGPLGELPRVLAPLAKLKSEALVISNCWNAGSSGDGLDGHYAKDGPFLTSTTITKTTGADVNVGGVSMDQLAAQHFAESTKLPSIELATENTRTGVDTNVQLTQLYGGHVSWSSPTTPMAKEIDPRQAFDRLFRDRVAPDKDAKDAAGKPARLAGDPEDDRSVLDAVRAQATAMKGRLGFADQRKLDEYLTTIRDLEKRIAMEEKLRKAPRKLDPAALRGLPLLAEQVKGWNQNDPTRGGHQNHCRLMMDIMAMAFWTDVTRVATFMFGNSVSGRNFSFLPGVNINHHDSSHHENNADKLEQYALMSTWHTEQLVYFMERLKAIKEGERTLLDNSMVLFGSGLSDGNAHDSRDLPIVLAGRGGGTLLPGRHIACKENAPLASLYVEMLRRMGLPIEQFADSKGPIPELMRA